MNRISKATIIFLLALILSGCKSVWSQSIPDVEIVFTSGKFGSGRHGIGFVQPDGSELTLIELGSLSRRFGNPVYSSDGSLLYGLNGMGYPAYWDLGKGKFRACTRNLPTFKQIEGTGSNDNLEEVLISNRSEILRMNLKTCESITLVEYDLGEFGIAGFSYLPAAQDLVYGLIANPYDQPDFRIMKLNLTTKEATKLVEGINPSWSPDGSRIAYIGTEGIYVMDADGEESRLLTEQHYYDPKQTNIFDSNTPVPRWSPDGEWIIYNGCAQPNCGINHTIYKIRSTGGQAEVVVSNGMNASWKP